ncbi:hypothetical protein PAAL66ix_14956 [Paenibacillus alvei A6-6i-x]|nr:hypothetical protein PAAL66ix_14956 [Paenibacillus alvei A6-6i-x]
MAQFDNSFTFGYSHRRQYISASKASPAQKGYIYKTADEARQKLKPEYRNSPLQSTLLWKE